MKAHISGGDLTGARLDNAGWTDAELGNAILVDIDLGQVQGLETVKHIAPSNVSIDTIYRSEGRVPATFLRGCGVPDGFINLVPALAIREDPLSCYSRFISYSNRDQDFAVRLHGDLQSRGIRVWLATEDLTIGDKFGARIDEASQLYDKVVLVLSENSIASAWVEKEAETAFEKERESGRAVLFQIASMML